MGDHLALRNMMGRFTTWLFLAFSTLVCQGIHPDDPRSLFANMYGGVYKRSAEDDPRNLFASMYGGNFKRSEAEHSKPLSYPESHNYGHSRQPEKRGRQDDPRSLFKSVYGGVYKRR